MEQSLKNRLVGAVVITSLAAIFVPMLFDDPVDETGKMISELKIPDAPVNTLNPETALVSNNTYEVIDLPAPHALKGSATQQNDSAMVRWFLQAGIFGQESNAITLRNKLRKQGFSATIMKVSGEAEPLYRVRVGPELDKKRAEVTKIKLDKLNHIKSILTSVDE